MRRPSVRVAILLLAVLHHPGQALAVTMPVLKSVTLAWDNSPDPNVAGYRIYYGSVSRTYTNMVDAGSATTATIPGLLGGTTYYFAATTYNSLGLESNYSTETSYTVPTITPPKVQIRMLSNRQIVLTVSGIAGHSYDILATPNLVVWNVIGRVTLGGAGSVDFNDTNAASFPKRFYRTRDTQP